MFSVFISCLILVTFKVFAGDATLIDPIQNFDYHAIKKYALSEAEKTQWRAQRENIANELVRRAETNVKAYTDAVSTRTEFVEKLKTQANELHKLEKNYTPYEKGSGNKAYEINELRTRMQQTSQTIERLNSDIQTSFRAMARSAKNAERFFQQSRLAKTTTDQMNLMKSSMGKSMMVYANNPHVANMLETIKGTSIGKGIAALPSGLIEEGVLKTQNDKNIKYKVGENVLIRNTDGGIVKGSVMGATPKGELVIKEAMPAGMQPLKQGEYRVVNVNEVSSVSMIRSSSNIKEALSDPLKFQNIGGRTYEIKLSETTLINRIRMTLSGPPALSGSNPIQQTGVAPARPIGTK